MAEVDKDAIETPLLDLTKLLKQVSEQAKDRLECYRELVDWEYIPEEIFNRMILNEKQGIIEEIENILDYYRGFN